MDILPARTGDRLLIPLRGEPGTARGPHPIDDPNPSGNCGRRFTTTAWNATASGEFAPRQIARPAGRDRFGPEEQA
jgi:hypothetical protein